MGNACTRSHFPTEPQLQCPPPAQQEERQSQRAKEKFQLQNSNIHSLHGILPPVVPPPYIATPFPPPKTSALSYSPNFSNIHHYSPQTPLTQQVAQAPQILSPRFPPNIHQPQPSLPHIYHHQYPPYSFIAPLPSSPFIQPHMQHSTSIPQHLTSHHYVPDPKK